MKKVLIVHYSQTGQLSSLARNFAAPLQTAGVQVDCVNIVPEQTFPFPWPFWRFFDTFPETVHLKPAPILPPQIPSEDYDVVVIAYTVWFLSPSQPMTAFLQREETRRLLDGKPVITLIGCRNMWLGAQEKMKSLLKQNGAKLIGNIVKIDACNSAASFITTPAWMLTGDKRYFRSLPSAGIAEEELADAARFGTKLRDTLLNQQPLDETLFQNMGAVTVNEKLIFSERAAGHSFFVWGQAFDGGRPYFSALAPCLVVLLHRIFIGDDFGGFTCQRDFEKTAASAAQRPSEKTGGLLRPTFRRINRIAGGNL